MSVRLAPAVVDSLLLGPENRRRQLQDFPILGDVWGQFADQPDRPHDLLILPTRDKPTGVVAAIVADAGNRHNKKGDCSVAYLQDLVVATLDFDDLYATLIPATQWWDQIEDRWEGARPKDKKLKRWIAIELRDTLGRLDVETLELAAIEPDKRLDPKTTDHRQVAKLGLLVGVLAVARATPAPDNPSACVGTLAKAVKDFGEEKILEQGAAALLTAFQKHKELSEGEERKGCDWSGVIFQVTLNREASPALAESVPAIKADAARTLFSISCDGIAWAVLDSGIDETHEAFIDHGRVRKDAERAQRKGLKAAAGGGPLPHRIKACFELRRIRRILGVADSDKDREELAKELGDQTDLTPDAIKTALAGIAADRKNLDPVDWRKVEPLIRLAKPTRPTHPHGTHVAGIIGADWRDRNGESKLQGVCPDIDLYDFRVIGSDLGDSEFAVGAALQFIRFMNEQSGGRIHGINMSLAIRHNVRNYACGRTPVCNEAEALVANGVVVVAAAGNRGYQSYQLADSTTFESYAASSITDPGNAEGVITVGATHRQWPHTYGVSFFSSRGPTGDGRMKPDLLAPGEKIVSCVPGSGGGRQDQMDGTSMAAPHVSGAAALLMARHKELKGQPARIKEILCSTATDLKRDRSFQGHGMVDVLRAIQSI